MNNLTWETLNNNLPENRDLHQDSLDFLDGVKENFDNMEDIEEERFWEIFPALLSVSLLLFYLYAWVVTKSLFSQLGHQEQAVAPGLQALGTGPRRPNAKLFAIGVVSTQHHHQTGNHDRPPHYPPQYNSSRVAPELPWYLTNGNGGPLPTIQVEEPQTNNGRY